MYLIFWERGVWGGWGLERWVEGEEYQEGDGAGGVGGEKMVKGMERDESRKQGMGEDRDGERRGGIMRGKEVENDSPSLQTTPCW